MSAEAATFSEKSIALEAVTREDMRGTRHPRGDSSWRSRCGCGSRNESRRGEGEIDGMALGMRDGNSHSSEVIE